MQKLRIPGNPPKKCWGEDRIRQNRPLCEDYMYLDKEQTNLNEQKTW